MKKSIVFTLVLLAAISINTPSYAAQGFRYNARQPEQELVATTQIKQPLIVFAQKELELCPGYTDKLADYIVNNAIKNKMPIRRVEMVVNYTKILMGLNVPIDDIWGILKGYWANGNFPGLYQAMDKKFIEYKEKKLLGETSTDDDRINLYLKAQKCFEERPVLTDDFYKEIADKGLYYKMPLRRINTAMTVVTKSLSLGLKGEEVKEIVEKTWFEGDYQQFYLQMAEKMVKKIEELNRKKLRKLRHQERVNFLKTMALGYVGNSLSKSDMDSFYISAIETTAAYLISK